MNKFSDDLEEESMWIHTLCIWERYRTIYIGNEQMKRYHMATSTIPEKIKEGRKVRKVNNTDEMTIFCQGLLHIPKNTSSLSKETVRCLVQQRHETPITSWEYHIGYNDQRLSNFFHLKLLTLLLLWWWCMNNESWSTEKIK